MYKTEEGNALNCDWRYHNNNDFGTAVMLQNYVKASNTPCLESPRFRITSLNKYVGIIY